MRIRFISRMNATDQHPMSVANRVFASILLLLLLSGCAGLRFILLKAGKPEQPAEYIPLKVPTVVYVLDQPDPSGVNNQAEEIAARIEQQLEAYELVPIVASSKIAE